MRKFAKRSHEKFTDELFDATEKGVKMSKRRAPKDEGDLWQNIHSNYRNNMQTGEIISEKNYSAAVEHGTKPHHIRIKSKSVLAGPIRKAPPGWAVRSGEYAIYGTKVQHPGTQPQPFMMPGFKFAKKKFMDGLRRVFK